MEHGNRRINSGQAADVGPVGSGVRALWVVFTAILTVIILIDKGSLLYVLYDFIDNVLYIKILLWTAFTAAGLLSFVAAGFSPMNGCAVRVGG